MSVRAGLRGWKGGSVDNCGHRHSPVIADGLISAFVSRLTGTGETHQQDVCQSEGRLMFRCKKGCPRMNLRFAFHL
jgi:hypothetical protein